MELSEKIVKIKIEETKPITLKEWFSNFRKEVYNTIDTPENRLALHNRLVDFKKYWRTIHPIIPKIKSMKAIIYVDEKERQKSNYKTSLLTEIWRDLCNFYTCEECPFSQDEELCYDSQLYDYDKFENFLRNLKK